MFSPQKLSIRVLLLSIKLGCLGGVAVCAIELCCHVELCYGVCVTVLAFTCLVELITILDLPILSGLLTGMIETNVCMYLCLIPSISVMWQQLPVIFRLNIKQRMVGD